MGEHVVWNNDHQTALNDRMREYKLRLEQILAKLFPDSVGGSTVRIVSSQHVGDTALLFTLSANAKSPANRAQLERAVKSNFGTALQAIDGLVDKANSSGDHLDTCPTVAVQIFLGAIDPPLKRSWKSRLVLLGYTMLLLLLVVLLYWTIVPARQPVAAPVQLLGSAGNGNWLQPGPGVMQVDDAPYTLHRPRPARGSS